MTGYLAVNAVAIVLWLGAVYQYFGNRAQLTGQPMPPRRRDIVALTTTVLCVSLITPLFTEWMTTGEKITGLAIVLGGLLLVFGAVRVAGEKASRRARIGFERRRNTRIGIVS